MVGHLESVSQRLDRDPNDPLERRAQVQDCLDRPRNGNRTKEQHHRCGRVRRSNRPKLMKSRHSQNKATSNTGTGIPSTSCSIKKPPHFRYVGGQLLSLRRRPALLCAVAFHCRQAVLTPEYPGNRAAEQVPERASSMSNRRACDHGIVGLITHGCPGENPFDRYRRSSSKPSGA
jgi:hypothetical protein